MKNISLSLVTIFCLFFGAGCSTIYENDTRSAKTEWNDSKVVIDVAGIVNKPEFKGLVRLNAVSYQGKVLIVGQAVNETVKQQVAKKVESLKNVDEVFNQLRVRPLLNLSEIGQDTWITTKVKSNLVASKKLMDVNIKVLTEDKEVFLLGYVTDTQADIAVDIARHISGVKQVIKGFNYVEAKPQPEVKQ
ncbi:hemolysin [Veronia nyctiphanis]|uniref:Hemolysin n=1 Tax=Veronia nyctiphanis TaxID=1278244 RepID=A0A4Q0YNC6_9GAMM|nr:BON domain-containing protein [Veronia nyctiphanis]RXJ71905.1 hemolysin [Veronia nyctiphanis]